MSEFNHSFENSPIAARAALRAAMDFLTARDLYSTDVEIALAEAINNVVDHAYQDHSGFGRIVLRTNKNAVLECTVLDKGTGVKHKPKCQVATSISELATHGHGINLMAQLSTRMDFGKSGKEHYVRLTFAKT